VSSPEEIERAFDKARKDMIELDRRERGLPPRPPKPEKVWRIWEIVDKLVKGLYKVLAHDRLDRFLMALEDNWDAVSERDREQIAKALDALAHRASRRAGRIRQRSWREEP
jgi:hypothetical protein